MAKANKQEMIQGLTALIELPVAGAVTEPVIFRLDLGKLSAAHRATLNRVWRALREQHATLADGRHVDSVGDVVRWILDQIDGQIAERAA